MFLREIVNSGSLILRRKLKIWSLSLRRRCRCAVLFLLIRFMLMGLLFGSIGFLCRWIGMRRVLLLCRTMRGLCGCRLVVLLRIRLLIIGGLLLGMLLVEFPRWLSLLLRWG